MREHLSIYNFYFYFKILFLMICCPSSSLSLFFFSWIPCRDSFTTLVSKTIGKVHITLAKHQHWGLVDSRSPCGFKGLHIGSRNSLWPLGFASSWNEFYTIFLIFQPVSSFMLKIELSRVLVFLRWKMLGQLAWWELYINY